MNNNLNGLALLKKLLVKRTLCKSVSSNLLPSNHGRFFKFWKNISTFRLSVFLLSPCLGPQTNWLKSVSLKLKKTKTTHFWEVYMIFWIVYFSGVFWLTGGFCQIIIQVSFTAEYFNILYLLLCCLSGQYTMHWRKLTCDKLFLF